MGKVKKIFSNASELVKNTFKKFPITIIIVYIVTLLHIIGTYEFVEEFLYESYWFAFFGLAVLGTFLVENWFNEKSYKLIGTAISIVIALIFRQFSTMELSGNAQDLFYKIITTYTVIIPLLTIYKIIKNNNVEVKEYGIKVLANWGRCTLTYVLANIGIAIVISAFVFLILDGEDFDILTKTLILLLGGYYVPSLINALTDMTCEHGKFMKSLILYVFTPVTSFLIFIFYLYMAKVAISGELFKNELFAILSASIAIGIPIVLLLKNYDNSEKVKKFSNILIYAFVPLIILQIIAMTIRVNAYGLTSSRYLGYILIVFEIVLISLIIYKNSKYLNKILLFTVALVIICLLTPLNFIDVPIRNQASRLEKKIDIGFENLTEDEKKDCKSIYRYLKRNGGEEYLQKKLSKVTIKQIEDYEIDYTKLESYTEKKEIEHEYDYIYAYTTLDGLDISEYSKIYSFYLMKNDKVKDFSKIIVKSKNGEKEVEINIENFLEELIDANYENNDDKYLKENCIVKTKNPEINLFIESCSFEYEVYTKEALYFNLDGYILVK